MAPDPNDPAYKLAQAALEASKGDVDAIERAFQELKPTTITLARAYALCLSTQPFASTEGSRLMLSTLQYALAEKTAARLNILTWALVIVGVIVGGVDIYLRLSGRG